MAYLTHKLNSLVLQRALKTDCNIGTAYGSASYCQSIRAVIPRKEPLH